MNITENKKVVEYPFDKVVVIKSLLMFRNGDTIEVKGVGTVILNRYVVTCAHNLFYKWNRYAPTPTRYAPRKEACEARVYIPNEGWKEVNKMQWIIP